MSLNHQVKTVLWWCYLHTEFPATPAHILKTTITDQQIIDQFDKAATAPKHKPRSTGGEPQLTGPTSTTAEPGTKPTKPKPTRFDL